MKYLLGLLFIFNGGVFAQNQNAFEKFHTLFAKRDFVKLRMVLDKKILIISETNNEKFNIDDYLQDMENWARIFDTKWNVVSVKKIKDTTYAVEYDSDIFKKYFYDGGNNVKLKYVEKYGKLVYLSWNEGELVKREIFEKRFRDFAMWCYKKFPNKYSNLQYQTREALKETKFMLEEYLKEVMKIKST
jgi:hypothetical protein